MEVLSASGRSRSSSLSSSSNFLQDALRAFFGCLGVESNTKTQEETAVTYEPATEEYSSVQIVTVIRARAAPRSGLSSGSGGQTF